MQNSPARYLPGVDFHRLPHDARRRDVRDRNPGGVGGNRTLITSMPCSRPSVGRQPRDRAMGLSPIPSVEGQRMTTLTRWICRESNPMFFAPYGCVALPVYAQANPLLNCQRSVPVDPGIVGRPGGNRTLVRSFGGSVASYALTYVHSTPNRSPRRGESLAAPGRRAVRPAAVPAGWAPASGPR